jgi:hypothetical protein
MVGRVSNLSDGYVDDPALQAVDVVKLVVLSLEGLIMY